LNDELDRYPDTDSISEQIEQFKQEYAASASETLGPGPFISLGILQEDETMESLADRLAEKVRSLKQPSRRAKPSESGRLDAVDRELLRLAHIKERLTQIIDENRQEIRLLVEDPKPTGGSPP
jgi:hypothetical protein